jgi:hypothetical protein
LYLNQDSSIFYIDIYDYFRHESGFWEGEDESNIKLEITCDKLPTTRKVSKMLNGLGGDM